MKEEPAENTKKRGNMKMKTELQKQLFAFGYICGYISYDEYLIHAAPLAVYLQNEYDSWETMYESYYYGYLIFAGRNKNSSSSVIYSDYRYLN